MKKIQWVGAVAIGIWVAANSAHGETWADWLVPPMNAPLVAEFQAGWVVDPISREASRSSDNFVEPNRGYEGKLILSAAPDAAPMAGPLKVRLIYSVASPEEMNWPADEIPTGFVPAVLPEGTPRRAVAEEIWTVPAEFPVRVPVVLPRSCNSPMSWRNKKDPALFSRYEVLDAVGRTLCRGTLPARTLSENSRSLVGMDEGDEAMKKLTEKAGEIERVGDLPDELSAYRSVRSIWFTDSLWKKMEGREALVRRLLLSGVKISGKTALVERIRATLGTGRDGQVLGTAIASGSWNSGNEFSLKTLNLRDVSTGVDGHKQTVREESVFGNDVNLFTPDRNAYLTWTLAGLLVFGVGVAAILAVVFIRFKGEQRVAVWWALPAWTILCFAAIWLGGTQVLERRSRVDVTEYRLVMAGWPEMYCRAVASAMTFEPGRPEWRLPPSVVFAERSYGQLDGWWKREDAEISAEGIRLRLPRQMTGETLNLEAGWFEPACMPVVPEDGTLDAPGRWIVATENVEGVLVLAEGQWRNLGPMKAGDRLDPLAAKTLKENRLLGLPAALYAELPMGGYGGPCQNPEHHHVPVVAEPPPKHDWIVVAWKGDVPPRVVPVWKDSLTKGRVIWVMQCP